MKLINLFEDTDDNPGRYDPQQDTFTQRSPHDNRKPTLTLRRLNRLKKIRATKKLEQLKREDLLTVMYGQGGGEEEGGDLGGFEL
jgi:hypothetical protein